MPRLLPAAAAAGAAGAGAGEGVAAEATWSLVSALCKFCSEAVAIAWFFLSEVGTSGDCCLTADAAVCPGVPSPSVLATPWGGTGGADLAAVGTAGNGTACGTGGEVVRGRAGSRFMSFLTNLRFGWGIDSPKEGSDRTFLRILSFGVTTPVAAHAAASAI